jgi:hypothetical protein
MSKIQEIGAAIESGKGKNVQDLIGAAIGDGLKPMEVLQGMIDTMGAVGEKFKDGQIYVPEMLVAARAMKKGLETLKPHLVGGTGATIGKFIIGTVAGDLHDIGKNLVAMMVESQGFEVIDLGVDVKAEKFIDAIKANPDCKSWNFGAPDHDHAGREGDAQRLRGRGGEEPGEGHGGRGPRHPGLCRFRRRRRIAADAATAASKAKELNKRLN